MKDTGMKLYELTVNEDGWRFRHANPHPMTREQKYNIIMALIGTAALLGFFGIILLAAH